jgi:hypothetical protein
MHIMTSQSDRIDSDAVSFRAAEMRSAQSAGLLGACVARDMARALFTGSCKNVYFWRIGTISLMSAAPSALAIELPLEHHARLTLERDINKTFDLPLLLRQPYVVIDFFRDMYAALRLRDGRYVTNGIDLQDVSPAALGLAVVDRIEAFEPRYQALWLEAFRRFAALANAAPARFIITPVYQLATFLEDGRFRVEPSWNAEQIAVRNRLLGFMQRIALTLLDRAIIAPLLPEALALDPNHEYGAGPYHYQPAVFRRAIEIMTDTPELVQRVAADPARRQAIAAAEAAAWARSLTPGGVSATPAASATRPEPSNEQVEMVLPLRAMNDERGSDLLRARAGLIATLNHFCDASFVDRLSVVVPKDDVAEVSALAADCAVAMQVVPEDELLPTGRIGAIPRRGWYLQQLIKLAYGRVCRTRFYLTLDSDIFLIAPLDGSVLREGRAPLLTEPVAAHPGWWEASARALGLDPAQLPLRADGAFGVTPSFLRTAVVNSLLDRLQALAAPEDWPDYLCGLANNGNTTWTEYSLYWTHLLATTDPESLYYARPVYLYSHYPWHLGRTIIAEPARYEQLFAILQSIHVTAADHAGFVAQFLAAARTRAA